MMKDVRETFFEPYLDCLPQNCDHFPVFFISDELQYLKGSPILKSIEQKKTRLINDY